MRPRVRAGSFEPPSLGEDVMKFVVYAFVGSLLLALIALAAPQRTPKPTGPEVQDATVVRVVARSS